MEKLEVLQSVAPDLDQFRSVQSQGVDRGLSHLAASPRICVLLAESQVDGRRRPRRVDQQRLLATQIVMVRQRSPRGVPEREQVLFDALIAELAGEEEIGPTISKPVIPRSPQRVAVLLQIAGL